MLQTILLVLHNTLYRIAKKSAMVSGYNLIVVLRLCQQKWAERMYRYDYCHYTRIIIVPNISEMATGLDDFYKISLTLFNQEHSLQNNKSFINIDLCLILKITIVQYVPSFICVNSLCKLLTNNVTCFDAHFNTHGSNEWTRSL